MNKNFKALIVFVAGLMLAGVILQSETPMRAMPKTYEVFSGTSGAGTTHTFAKISFNWEVCNTDSTATNTLSIKLKQTPGQTIASNAAIVIRGNFCYQKSDVPVMAILVTAVSGTPAYQIVAHED